MLRDLLSMPSRVRRILARLEAAIGYFAARSHPIHYTPNAFLGDHTSLTLLQGRLKIYVDTRGNDLAPHLLLNGEWEPDETRLFERLIRPGDTVMDVGAHLGVFTLIAGVACGPTGQAHGFEPNPRLAGLLHRSILVNGLGEHTKVHNLAIGAEEGVAMLNFSHAWGGGGHLAVSATEDLNGGEQVACRVAALDDLFPDPDFQVHVMKMDVEGTESRAVRGMWNLLSRSAGAKVMFEFAPGMLTAQGSSATELIGLFQQLGFQFWTIGARAELQPAAPAELMAMTDGVRNILASRDNPLPA